MNTFDFSTIISARQVRLEIAIIALSFATSFAQSSSAIITLVMPPGARQAGLGEAGTALLDKHSSFFYNPALPGLSFEGDRRELTFEKYYSYLLPWLNLQDLYHTENSIALLPSENPKHWDFTMLPSVFWPGIGYVGLHRNQVNFGKITLTSEDGSEGPSVDSYERVYVLTLSPSGRDFLEETKSTGKQWDWNFGINAKYYESALMGADPAGAGAGSATATGGALDFGFAALYGFDKAQSEMKICGGLAILNLGPDVFYEDGDLRDPLPFQVNIGLGITAGLGRVSIFDLYHSRLIGLSYAVDFTDEVYDMSNSDLPFYHAFYRQFEFSNRFLTREVTKHVGFEACLLDMLYFRKGSLIDREGQRYEGHTGWGVKTPYLFDRVSASIDFYEIEFGETIRWNQKGKSIQFGIRF